MTITKYINTKGLECDILFIDECGVVNDSDMKKVLENNNSELLVLVGDIFQIESIGFGRWFSYSKEVMPKKAINELKEQYRTDNRSLQKLWKYVRENKENIIDSLNRYGISKTLSDSIFKRKSDDEIILCINYDGFYGINNINRILQESNQNPVFYWGTQKFKKGDPIIFHTPEAIGKGIYNNMKGKILNIDIDDNKKYIEFHIELEKKINISDIDINKCQLLDKDDCESSSISFKVYKKQNTDLDEDDLTTIIPFQISYAISIHKSQGLEYDSVKIIFPNILENKINHNIFYTAITRAKKDLTIYWSEELEEKFIKSIVLESDNKDISILKNMFPSFGKK
ncbi:ATP-dependent RecD-like DNA helicase [Mycoplasma mycoides]|uniref:ATP-dependent RecD-like DNA helicase n=1 Tax=Mycoplasma mycoides TaxID=2102 RepID=UPI0030B86E22